MESIQFNPMLPAQWNSLIMVSCFCNLQMHSYWIATPYWYHIGDVKLIVPWSRFPLNTCSHPNHSVSSSHSVWCIGRSGECTASAMWPARLLDSAKIKDQIFKIKDQVHRPKINQPRYSQLISDTQSKPKVKLTIQLSASQRLKTKDQRSLTLILVENEVGFLPAPRAGSWGKSSRMNELQGIIEQWKDSRKFIEQPHYISLISISWNSTEPRSTHHCTFF